MARAARKLSDSGYYHIIYKGCNGQVIFDSDEDRIAFLTFLKTKVIDAGVEVLAWALMSNHVHLVIEDPLHRMSEALHALGTNFAMTFNWRAGRHGPVFNDRYTSVAIADDSQLLEAVRYVHINPEKHRVASAETYPWSSYREYMNDTGITKRDVIYEMLGGPREFAAFIADRKPCSHFIRRGNWIEDEDALRAARVVIGEQDPRSFGKLPKAERDEMILKLYGFGITPKSIVRITGIGLNIVYRAIRSAHIRNNNE